MPTGAESKFNFKRMVVLLTSNRKISEIFTLADALPRTTLLQWHRGSLSLSHMLNSCTVESA